MKRLNLFHFAVIYVTAICSITSIPRYLILKGNSPHSLDLVLYSLFTTLLFITIILWLKQLTVNILYLQYVILLMYYKIKEVKGLTKYREIRKGMVDYR